METFYFVLVLDGVYEHTEGLEDALFEAGCDDALINYEHGVVYLDFDRQAKSLEEAILSAITSIESCGIGAIVKSIGPDNLVNMSEIGLRSSLTRQAISLFAKGERGQTTFPRPYCKVDNSSPLWRWSEVAEWLFHEGKISGFEVENAKVLESMNLALELRYSHTLASVKKLTSRLGAA